VRKRRRGIHLNIFIKRRSGLEGEKEGGQGIGWDLGRQARIRRNEGYGKHGCLVAYGERQHNGGGGRVKARKGPKGLNREGPRPISLVGRSQQLELDTVCVFSGQNTGTFGITKQGGQKVRRGGSQE